MIKNKMMRIASVLLVAVLLSTCAISGTFAKYVTSDNVADEARVAKWGVAVTATGSRFAGEYNADTTGLKDSTDTAIALSVKTSDSNKLVAPGTKNDSGMAFSITGTPEVAVNVKIEITYSDILRPGGTYADYTTGKDVTLEIRTRVKQVKRNFVFMEASIAHNGEVCSTGELTFYCFTKEVAEKDFLFRGCEVEE